MKKILLFTLFMVLLNAESNDCKIYKKAVHQGAQTTYQEWQNIRGRLTKWQLKHFIKVSDNRTSLIYSDMNGMNCDYDYQFIRDMNIYDSIRNEMVSNLISF